MTAATVVHMVREQSAGVLVARCGATGRRGPDLAATIWHGDVTCSACQAAMGG